jgi:chromosome transmission fidelity protein 4
VAAVSRTDWTKSFTLSDDTQLGDITALALSPNGVYLATASKSGVFIWSTQTRRVLIRLPAADSPRTFVTQLAWSPTQNVLAWTDSEGTLIRYHDIVPKTFADPVKTTAAAATTMKPVKRAGTPSLFDEVAGDDSAGKDDDVDLDAEDDGMHDFLDDDIGEYLKEDGGEAKFRSGQVEVGKYTRGLVNLKLSNEFMV